MMLWSTQLIVLCQSTMLPWHLPSEIFHPQCNDRAQFWPRFHGKPSKSAKSSKCAKSSKSTKSSKCSKSRKVAHAALIAGDVKCFARGVQKVICLQEEALDEVFEVGQQFDEGSLTITMTTFLIILKSVILGAVDESQQRFLWRVQNCIMMH